MTKSDITWKFISLWAPIFDKYPTLKVLPIYAWGRFQRYECAGEDYEQIPSEDGFNSFEYLLTNEEDEYEIDWEVMADLDRNYHKEIKHICDLYPKRREIVFCWELDEPGGNCFLLVRNEQIDLVMLDCDSPE